MVLSGVQESYKPLNSDVQGGILPIFRVRSKFSQERNRMKAQRGAPGPLNTALLVPICFLNLYQSFYFHINQGTWDISSRVLGIRLWIMLGKYLENVPRARSQVLERLSDSLILHNSLKLFNGVKYFELWSWFNRIIRIHFYLQD
jgi:hypothetical protein